MKKYILFDNDGVLVETEAWYYQANYDILKTLDIHLAFEEYQKIMIRGGTAWELAFNQGYSLKEVENLKEKRDELYQHYLQTKDITIAGINETLEELSKKYKMAIVTTSTRVNFELIHKNRGITKYMDFILCVEDYERAKPHPEPYLKALEKFNATANEAIVVEDSQRGLDSAYSANIDCIIVKNEFTKSHNFNKAKHFIDKFENLKELL
ncbi:HAD family hydrolase [Malaciobacter mytili LMG 24559]|uniref:phosphoglycolate phosphatase n=1 Tax=Malaciobacter mytili LMG 24559 TaxID=1032238 RepID=A0AAX2ALM2_9BACT|nr:HAD family phosphatase [Malaciobacter mytili]AXH14772.1 beta-phosphoglucomutase-like HAD superfamily hydrolase [Malaciobacter mytili LMG 24559]RXK16856.1 HAD family hydrolase [Malaciobacter mytili LMG 24559]